MAASSSGTEGTGGAQQALRFGPAAYLVEHYEMIRQRILDHGIEPQRHVATTDQLGGCLGITAGEQRNIVSHRDEFFGQGVDNPLGAAVQLGRYSLEQRRDLSNTHKYSAPV